MGLGERPEPVAPGEQIDRWLREGATLRGLLTQIRTPVLRAEITRRMTARAAEEREPRQGVTQAVIVTGG